MEKVLFFTIGAALGCVIFAIVHKPSLPVGFDHNGDGVLDEIFVYKNGAPSGLEMDRNMDGEIDFKLKYLPNGHLSSSFSDDDFDGIFETESNYINNLISSSRIDSNKDGKVDTVWYYEYGVANRSLIFDPATNLKYSENKYFLGKPTESSIDSDNDGIFDLKCSYGYFENRICQSIDRGQSQP